MSTPIESFKENLADVRRLLELHENTAGTAPGRKYHVEVLNKSGVVLALACWEAFVEDCAVAAFDFITQSSSDASKISQRVQRFVAKQIREDKHELAPWQLADTGWKTVLATYRDAVVKEYVGSLNTPSHKNVDALFDEMLGLTDVSAKWRRHKMTPDEARKKLAALVKLRGAIAHRTKSTRAVHKNDVRDAANLTSELADMTSNAVRSHVHSLVGSHPWDAVPDPPRAGRKPKAPPGTP